MPDMCTIKEYISDLKALLDEADSATRKTILRSFVRKIVTDDGKVMVEYKLPMPQENERRKKLVLPTVTLGGAEVSIGSTSTDFNFTFALGNSIIKFESNKLDGM
jgi:hypothetical protein